jgi:hypothetical protein
VARLNSLGLDAPRLSPRRGARRTRLPALPLAEWETTKDTLHLWVQIVGKVRLASTSPLNHWWHVPLYLDVRGLTTRRMHAPNGLCFEIDFDFIDHGLQIVTSRGEAASFDLVDGLSVAAFDAKLHAALSRLGVEVAILETPYGVSTTTPFPDDQEHATYDADAVARFWRILAWSDEVFQEFTGRFAGKTSPVHFFWHSFDLALTRFSGRRAPESPNAGKVTREAYSHEVISFGFWPGDEKVREPSYYSYTAPEPPPLRTRSLNPEEASWTEGASSLALLPYECVRTAAEPRATLLEFLESAYRAGAEEAGWDIAGLRSSWVPPGCE